MKRQIVLFLVVLACYSEVGCREPTGRPGMVAISGQVTCNGEPLSQSVMVQFIPTGRGRMAFGPTGADGRFALSTYRAGDGAVVGRHQVTVVIAAPEPEESVPDAVADHEDTDPDLGQPPLPCSSPSELFVALTSETRQVLIELADGGSVTTQ